MSRLDKLIQQYCPNGVEYKPLGELCAYIRGVTYNKSAEINTGVGDAWEVLRANNITLETNTLNFDDIKKISKTVRVKPEQFLLQGDILICAGSGSKEHIGKVAYISEAIPYTFGGFMAVIRCLQEVNSRFLYHLLTGESFTKYLGTALNATTINNLNAGIMNNFSIPIPPVPVQEEIVRILDNFSELTAELKTKLAEELIARKKQYEYYRDELLTFDDRVEWKTLGEIATEIYRGSGITRNELTNEGIPCVRYGEIYTTYNVHFENCVSHTNETKIKNKKYFGHGDILFAITGESVEEIAKSTAYTGDKKCLAGGDIVVLKHNLNPKYLGYALSTNNAQQQKSKGKIKSKVVHSSVPAISSIKIPVPSLSEQQRIVDILDRFDALCNDISQGLPAEIEARQKQYEYYRDKLLNFERLGSSD